MSQHKNAFIFAVSFIALGASATYAADLDPAYGMIPPLQQERVELGSGWYVRGDIGATQNYAVQVDRVSNDAFSSGIRHTSKAGYDLSLGGGYSFTNGFRGDVTGDFHQPASTNAFDQLCVSVSTTNCQMSGKFASYDALVNGYFDLGTWYRITPYVGAGVGVAFGNVSATISGDPNGNYYGKISYHNLAFAGMAGISLDLIDHAKLDIGYRYVNNGRAGNTDIYFHEIRAGIRYMIDN